MMYYIATPIDFKPLIIWQTTDLKEGLLVVTEDKVPLTQFGVCPLKIVGGQLEQRTPAEMAGFEAEYIADTAAKLYQNKANVLATAYFTYEAKSYPLHDTARLYYSVIERTPGNYKVRHADGVQDIMMPDNNAFLEAYYNKLKELTQP